MSFQHSTIATQPAFRSLQIVLIYLVLLPIASLNSYGQEIALSPDKKLSQYVLQSWNTSDGMASESTNEILQTSDGYIWIATYAGLHRFDGKDFTVFDGTNSSLASPDVLCIKKGKSNRMWIGSLHGVSVYESGRFYTPEALKKTYDYSIEEMLVTRSGDLWFSTKSNELFRYQSDSLQEYTNELNLKKSTVLAMLEDSAGNVYFGTDDSRFIRFTTEGTFELLSTEKSFNSINCLNQRNGKIYLGTGAGIYQWSANRLKKENVLSDAAITTILFDAEETMWIGTQYGLYRWDKKQASLDELTEDNGMPNNIVRGMTFDERGHLWVSTYRSGIFLLSDGTVTSFTESDGLETNVIAGVTERADGSILLGNENGALNLLRDGKILTWQPPIDIRTSRLKHLFTDRKGAIWVSTYDGLYVLDQQNSQHFSLANGFPDNQIRVAFEDSKGNMWIGTKNAGLVCFKSRDSWFRLSLADGLSSNYIMSIEENAKGQLIVGTISGLNIIEDAQVTKTVTVDDGLPSNFMFSTFSTENYIWLATNDGLTGYGDTEVVNYNSENGLIADIVYNLQIDDNGDLWMPSEHSILKINLAALESAAKQPEKEIDVEEYDRRYGMKNSQCLGAVHSFTDSKGRIWIPTLGGIVKLNPEEVKAPPFSPRLIFEGFYAGDIELQTSQGSKVVVPANGDRLQIDFTAISYAYTKQLQFRYQMIPFDDNWIMGTRDRKAIYTNLSPGQYEFKLQVGIDNQFSSQVLSKQIIIEAAWWQTVWAKVVAVMAIIGLAFLIYWLRLKALTSSNLRLERTVNERTRAIEQQKNELNEAFEQLKQAQEQMVQSDKMASLGILSAGVAHEINNPLNFIKGGVEGLEFMLTANENIKPDEYTVLLGAIKEGISRASTIVSSLNEFSHSTEGSFKPVDIHHLLENCLTMIQFRVKHDIDLTRNFSEQPLHVMGNNGKLHQAFLNILTNGLQAIEGKGSVQINTSLKADRVLLEFTDSGQGIKPEHLKKITEPFFSTKDPGKGTGLGLSITYSIITEHHGTLSYTSEWGKGTTATISLPALDPDHARDDVAPE